MRAGFIGAAIRDRIAPDTLTFEMWPDMTEYSAAERFAAPGFTDPDGTPAYLFSSDNPATVRRHFEWMRDYGIDGVWLQHFLVDLPGGPFPNATPRVTRVLGYVRAAARETGRAWAIAFDIAGMPTDRIFETPDPRMEEARRRRRHRRPPLPARRRPARRAGLGFLLPEPAQRHDAPRSPTSSSISSRPPALLTPSSSAAAIGTGDATPTPNGRRFYRRFDAYSPWNIGNYSWDARHVSHASHGLLGGGQARMREERRALAAGRLSRLQLGQSQETLARHIDHPPARRRISLGTISRSVRPGRRLRLRRHVRRSRRRHRHLQSHQHSARPGPFRHSTKVCPATGTCASSAKAPAFSATNSRFQRTFPSNCDGNLSSLGRERRAATSARHRAPLPPFQQTCLPRPQWNPGSFSSRGPD